MRAIVPSLAAVVLVLALPSPTRAQEQTPAPAAPATPAPVAQTAPPPPPSSRPAWLDASSHWTAAGFIGSNFGSAAANATMDFGGQVGYLYRGLLGGEFLADFAPNFNMNNALLTGSPTVNAYMLNLIAAAPLGSDFRFQPYISGGFGGVQLRSSVLATTIIGTTVSTTTESANGSRFGGDVGAGIMAFVGSVGLRGDIRYFRAFTGGATNATSPADVFAASTLSGLDFWRANIGIALRW